MTNYVIKKLINKISDMFIHTNKQTMEENDYTNIRKKIIINDDGSIDQRLLDKYSDLELAARYCKNPVNFTIFENLLKKNSKNITLINKTLIPTVRSTDAVSCINALKLLISYGANLNLLHDYIGYHVTPLMAICYIVPRKTEFEIVKFLIENDSDVNIINRHGYNALLLICQRGNFKDFEIIKLLLENNSNFDNSNGNTWSCLMCTVNNSNYDIAKLLIEKGADVNFINYNGDNILNLLCSNRKDNKIIELLIENGADVNSKNKFGGTPLMNLIKYSSSSDNFKSIKLLISKGSQVNSKDEKSKTPMMMYYKKNKNKSFEYEIIKLLLDNKADIYIKNKNGDNILNIVENRTGKHSKIYSLIFNYKNLYDVHLCECDINFIY